MDQRSDQGSRRSAKRGLGFMALVLLVLGTLVFVLVFFGGTQTKGLLRRIWFLRAETPDIPGVWQVSYWTMWNMCGPLVFDSRGDFGVDGRAVGACGDMKAGFRFDPQRNFNTKNLPKKLVGTDLYYHMSGALFGVSITSFLFALFSIISGTCALFTRSVDPLTRSLPIITLLLHFIANLLMIGTYVPGRAAFLDGGRKADLGVAAFVMMGGSWVLFLLSTIFFLSYFKSCKRRSIKAAAMSVTTSVSTTVNIGDHHK